MIQIDAEKAQRFLDNQNIDITVIEGLGLELVEETYGAQCLINNNDMSRASFRILSCRWKDQPAWVLSPMDCVIPFWEWGPAYQELNRWLDTIIAEAHRLNLPILVLIDREAPFEQLDHFRGWLCSKYEFVGAGNTIEHLAQVFVHSPDQKETKIPNIPKPLQEFFRGVKTRLRNDPADLVWFERSKRKVLAVLFSKTEQ